jgi:SAM-dependent methyltransferase
MSYKGLHIGCFDQPAEGWYNTDITPHIWIAKVPGAAAVLRRLGKLPEDRYQQHKSGVFRQVRYLDVAKRFPFADGMFENAFCSHLLEHLYPDEARRCVGEVARVLKKGGIFRVVVPDLEKLLALYDPERADEFCETFFESSQKSDKNQHHWHYNAASMIRLLEGAGFAKAYRCEYREGRCPDLDKLDNRPAISLFVEAQK